MSDSREDVEVGTDDERLNAAARTVASMSSFGYAEARDLIAQIKEASSVFVMPPPAPESARIAELEAKVARVEALAEKWDTPDYVLGDCYASDARAALRGDEDE